MDTDNWVDERMAVLNPDPDWQPDRARALARLRERRSTALVGPAVWAKAIALGVSTSLVVFFLLQPKALAQHVVAPCADACEGILKKVDLPYLPRAVKAMREWSDGVMARSAGVARPMAPDFTLKDANGEELRLSAFRGRVVLLNFWATWCPPCRIETPWFVEFERRFKDQGLVVIGVSLDEDGWTAVRPFVESAKINYRIGIGDAGLAHRYGGIESLPETLLIDREGRIVASHVGLRSKDDFEREIRALLVR
ncbi:MAG: TlpA disulfide reductase family protein [Bryobacteraceae bacterium]